MDVLGTKKPSSSKPPDSLPRPSRGPKPATDNFKKQDLDRKADNFSEQVRDPRQSTRIKRVSEVRNRVQGEADACQEEVRRM